MPRTIVDLVSARPIDLAIVEGPAHCGACHTPKNTLGGDETRHALAGSSLQGWYAPDLTGNVRRGLGSWSADDIVAYLRARYTDKPPWPDVARAVAETRKEGGQ